MSIIFQKEAGLFLLFWEETPMERRLRSGRRLPMLLHRAAADRTDRRTERYRRIAVGAVMMRPDCAKSRLYAVRNIGCAR